MARIHNYCVARASGDLAAGRAYSRLVDVHNAVLVGLHDTCGHMESVGAARS